MSILLELKNLTGIDSYNLGYDPLSYPLIAYWDILRGNRSYPFEEELDEDAMGGLWDSCFHIAIDAATVRQGICFSYVGKHLMPIMNNTVFAKSHMPHIKKYFNQVVDTQLPVFDEYQAMDEFSQNMEYYCCMAPLGDAKTITHVVGSLTLKKCQKI